jgi:hypothetical protein
MYLRAAEGLQPLAHTMESAVVAAIDKMSYLYYSTGRFTTIIKLYE